MVVVVTRRVPMTRGASLRSRVKGNFQARFWNSGGRGDSPADCSGMWLLLDGACFSEGGGGLAEYLPQNRITAAPHRGGAQLGVDNCPFHLPMPCSTRLPCAL